MNLISQHIDYETQIREKLSDPKDIQDYMDNMEKLQLQIKVLQDFIKDKLIESRKHPHYHL